MKLDRLLLISISLVLIVSETPPVLAQLAPREPEGTATSTQAPPPPDTRYRVQRGDVIALSFPFVPDFNQTVTVQPDGFVTLRVIGALRVDGMTVPELTDNLRTEYTSILRDPVITVELAEFERPYFVVAGAVERPGRYDLRGDTTVTQGVAVAGGLRRGAKDSQAVVFHRDAAGGFEPTKVNMKEMMKESDLDADVRLQSGDLLFVPGGRGGEMRFSDVLSSVGVVLSSVWIISNL